MEYKDVRMIGIWGMGGIGKTTIAKAVYNTLRSSYVDCSFIVNVRENSSNREGMIKLQKQFLSEVLREKDVRVFSVDEGINLIRDRLCYKKVLLVLDDVDKLQQLDALAGGRDWFGNGSRIIITTRDRHCLTSHWIDDDEIFDVGTLSFDESCKLFSSHVFPTDQMRRGIAEGLVKNILGYAKGLPLALEVLGSFLHGRNEPEWRSALERLEKTPDKTVSTLLKVSFDGLEKNERGIFLDIACFFKGNRFEDVKKVLDSCGFDTIIGIRLLVERSLITIVDGAIEMHDLLLFMAIDIVRREDPDNPGMRSRLWLYDDFLEVLFRNQVTTNPGYNGSVDFLCNVPYDVILF